MEKPLIRCAIYTRKSTDENLELDYNSLDAQRDSCQSYIQSQKSLGWVCLPDRYDDGGFSGGTIERPAFKKLMQDVENGMIDCIAVYKIDRLSRSLLDFGRIMETLERHHVSLVSVTQQFNTTTSMGRLTLNILLSFAQFEREIISERTRDKIAASRKKGKWTGGKPILGYNISRDRTGSRLVINGREAKRIKQIYKNYLDTGSLSCTARWANEQGWQTKKYPTKRGKMQGGKRFDKGNIHRILSCALYTGKVPYKDKLYDGEHQAIITEDLFKNVQTLLKTNRNGKGGSPRNKYNALLKGLVRCKNCGYGMTHYFTSNGNRQYRYYLCINARKHGKDICSCSALPAQELEDYVVNKIRLMCQDKKIKQNIFLTLRQKYNQQRELNQKQKKSLKEQIRRIDLKIRNLALNKESDINTIDDLVGLQKDLQLKEQQLKDLHKHETVLDAAVQDEQEVMKMIEEFDPMWESLTVDQRLQLIRLVIEQIEYDEQEQTISISYYPTEIKAAS